MKLLQELLTLREGKDTLNMRALEMYFKDSDVWQGVGSKSELGTADVTVEFEIEKGSHTDVPYGEGHARIDEPPELSVTKVYLDKDTDTFDEDGEVNGKLKKGTDLMKETWWEDKWTEWYADQIATQVEKYNPRDDY